MRYVYQAVERIPKALSNGVVYHSEEFEVGALLCACGCGHRVSLLVPDSHQITSEGGMATVRPSIAVCDAPCKSHYYISAGRVEWLPAFSEAMAISVMRDQIARHAVRDEKQQSWGGRIRAAIVSAYNTLRSILRI
ncbi:MAG: hypothetical protein KGL35_01965 [Bradyrhizobium sp.]|nr:hypothetical protein [Pseudomonadota bacterium]MDE2467530.1 hypothetical protein [Bradyrhizobium sp.]